MLKGRSTGSLQGCGPLNILEPKPMQSTQTNGQYIVLEGVKGVGKSTLLRHLQDWLTQMGLTYQLLCPTRPLPADHVLEHACLQNPDDDSLRQRLYAARSSHHARQVDFRRGLVLGDRSILTSLVTRWPEGAALSQLREYIQQVRLQESVIPLPDHVILLDVPDPLLRERLYHRQRNYGQCDEAPVRLDAARRAYTALQSQAKALGLQSIQWHRISTDIPPEHLADCVGQQIMKLAKASLGPVIN